MEGFFNLFSAMSSCKENNHENNGIRLEFYDEDRAPSLEEYNCDFVKIWGEYHKGHEYGTLDFNSKLLGHVYIYESVERIK